MSEQNSINHKNMLPVGATLQMGKYRVEKCLASGGFGNTYVVMNTKFEERMAMKEFFMRGVSERNDHSTVSVSNADNQLSFDRQREKFNKEAHRLRRLYNEHHNKHIVHVDDLFDENGTSYYVMEYIDGESFSQRLKRTKQPLSEDEALGVLDQVLDALDTVHAQGIWHLDLKPGNVMVDSQGVVKVIDFGASKQLTAGEGYTTTTTAMCYTPGYAPPEQIDQKMELIGPWTDIYALGGTLYSLLTCKQPPTVSELQDDDAFQYPAGVSERTRQLVQWMMSPQRAARPQSVNELNAKLKSKVPSIPLKGVVTAPALKVEELTVVQGTTPVKPLSPKPNVQERVREPRLVGVTQGQFGASKESNEKGFWLALSLLCVFVIPIIISVCSGNKHDDYQLSASSEWASASVSASLSQASVSVQPELSASVEPASASVESIMK